VDFYQNVFQCGKLTKLPTTNGLAIWRLDIATMNICFSIWLWFQQTFAIWLFVVNLNFSFLFGSSYGQTFFKYRHSTKPSTLAANLKRHYHEDETCSNHFCIWTLP
jgi:hypothetical protein